MAQHGVPGGRGCAARRLALIPQRCWLVRVAAWAKPSSLFISFLGARVILLGSSGHHHQFFFLCRSVWTGNCQAVVTIDTRFLDLNITLQDCIFFLHQAPPVWKGLDSQGRAQGPAGVCSDCTVLAWAWLDPVLHRQGRSALLLTTCWSAQKWALNPEPAEGPGALDVFQRTLTPFAFSGLVRCS